MEQSHQFTSPHPSQPQMINDPGFAPAWADDAQQNTAKLSSSAAEEMVPSSEEGQAELETSAGMKVPGQFLGMSRASAEAGF